MKDLTALQALEIKGWIGTEHPGYIVGTHWLIAAYERICAGEPEEDVLNDYFGKQAKEIAELKKWDEINTDMIIGLKKKIAECEALKNK
jgi:hypothetical protein